MPKLRLLVEKTVVVTGLTVELYIHSRSLIFTAVSMLAIIIAALSRGCHSHSVDAIVANNVIMNVSIIVTDISPHSSPLFPLNTGIHHEWC